ncbi:hypothetical protein [Jongsikchunia kroppenstedtii]|uniref:hypothetical protein n=1 Tax=Jongsikchunia kroppenstedtii TaxID=1121721 RepID=UPI001FE101E6|nr:hypothetical protein [Jongsikchunia kroppenstedtii]
MKRSVAVAAGSALAASGLGLGVMVGAGTAQAGPQDCTVTRDLVSATATCHDHNAPAGREYTVVVECNGLHGVPNAFPLMAFGPYRGSWGGSFGPSGHGSASCLGPFSVGVAAGAHVEMYRS